VIRNTFLIYKSGGRKSTSACRHGKGVEQDVKKPIGVMRSGFLC
jgi:hypothetical protein